MTERVWSIKMAAMVLVHISVYSFKGDKLEKKPNSLASHDAVSITTGSIFGD
jgi:hypothetical protein